MNERLDFARDADGKKQSRELQRSSAENLRNNKLISIKIPTRVRGLLASLGGLTAENMPVLSPCQDDELTHKKSTPKVFVASHKNLLEKLTLPWPTNQR